MWMRWVALCAVAGWMSACAPAERPQPLTPGAFAAPRHEESTPMEPLSSADQPGSLRSPARQPSRAPAPAPARVEAISPMVQENVRLPADGEGRATTERATTAPATLPAQPTTSGAASGQYVQVGGVVAVVNGTAIYAHDVIRRAEPALAARAKDLEAEQFRLAALHEIRLAVQTLVADQLEYAAAEQNLDQRDKDLADMLTMRWRQEQINAAGGSESVARRRAAARGEDFDDLVREKYRENMVLIYRQKKIAPRVQISADEIRAYYLRHREREFTRHAAATFRLIKIDKAKRGGRDEALHFITQLRNRIAKAGESFVAIAHSANDDPRLLKSGGELGTAIEKGAFAISEVDDAVWNTDAGKVTDIIETPSAFYIALVEEKTTTQVQPFSEEVQAGIDRKLSNELYVKQRMADREKLIKAAIVHSTETMLNIAVDMAMQNYRRWRGE